MTGSNGVKTLAPTNGLCNLCQKLRTLMSARSSSLLSGVVLNVGSFLTSLDIIDGISAVTFTISLWWSVTNPLILHVNTWSMLYFALQTHSCGKHLSSHPYLNKTASKNSRLVNKIFSCFNGKDDILKHCLMLLYHWLLIVLESFCFEGFWEGCHKIWLKI